ncbi:MAG TPA: PKD domain-containing protein [Solirubrobacteraceae bacterium]
MRSVRRATASGLSAVALAASAALLAVTSAWAAPTWLAPSKLSATGANAEGPQLSVDEQGDALAVWQRFNGAANVVEAASRPAASGSWQAPVAISSAKAEASLPQVALDSHGDAVAVWLSLHGGEYAIEASTRSGLGGPWQSPVTLQTLGALIPMEARPDLAVDSRGDAVAVWRRLEGAETIVEAASMQAGGSWQPPETISKKAEDLHPAEVAIDDAGDATAVWEEKGGEVLIDAARKPAGGKRQSAVALSAPGANANEPRLAVDARGDAVAVWERFEGEELIEAASRPATSAAWGKAVALTKPELGKGEPAAQQVAIDAQGEAVAVWSRTNATHDFVEAAVGRTSSSAWQPPASLSGPGANIEEQPQVAADGQGDAVVVWERFDGTNEVVEAAAGLAASGSWKAPVALSASGEEAREQQAAIDAQGNAAALWGRFDGKDYVAEAAGYDAAGPTLGSLVIPAGGAVGQSLAFSVSPFDTWSALGTTSWSFGDGATQTGTSVVHAYSAAGAYTVTLTSADALGNATSTSAAVSVAPGPVSKSLPFALVTPRITGARLTHSRFRVSRRPTAISAKAKAPQGTTFSFTLNEVAKLQVAFTHSVPGLRDGRRCVAPSAKLRRRHAKRCTRTATVGTLTRASEPAGADSVPFSGRIGKTPLRPGAYKAVLTATAGGLRSAPVTLALTIVR